MQIAVGLIVAAALAPLFLLIPALALQTLLRRIAPAPARRLPAMGDDADDDLFDEAPTRPLELVRAES